MSWLSRLLGRAPAGPLPVGLVICKSCGEARGTTAMGQVSACFCSGLVCNFCGTRSRRPISDYYDTTGKSWWHVPWFRLQAHRCPPGTPRGPGEQWTKLEPDPDVRAYQDAVTRLTLETMARPNIDRTKVERTDGPA